MVVDVTQAVRWVRLWDVALDEGASLHTADTSGENTVPPMLQRSAELSVCTRKVLVLQTPDS